MAIIDEAGDQGHPKNRRNARRRRVRGCRRRFAETAEIEAVLAYLRDDGASKCDSIDAVQSAFKVRHCDAKAIVHLSATWRDRYARDEALHDLLERIWCKFPWPEDED